jgi:hypothetical protein
VTYVDPQFAALDGRYFGNPKIDSMTNEEQLVHLRAICFSALTVTDGRISHEEIARIAGKVLARASGTLVPISHDEIERLVASLVARGLLDRNGHGYEIHDWLAFNPSREQVEQEAEDGERRRSRWRERKRRSRVMSRGTVTRDTVFNRTAVQSVSSNTATATEHSALPFSKNGRMDWSSIAACLADADPKTPAVIQAVRRKHQLPDAALHSAIEALEQRRRREPPLVSEARYFVATLNGIGENGQYA